MMKPSTARVGLGVAALALATAGTVITAQPANAKADTSCQRPASPRSRARVCSTTSRGADCRSPSRSSSA